ncbi:MAG: protein kinase family protein [Candidatus Xenobia bacterium]
MDPSTWSDAELASRLAAARPLGSGIGGSVAVLDVDGTPVFVKRVPVTEVELASPMSTANLFALPLFYQYGVGSAGFGVWREVAAHLKLGHPRLYNWRVVDGATPEPPERPDMVEYWGGSDAIRQRLEALANARRSVVLLLEYFPHTLHDWLATQDVEAACAFLDRRLLPTVQQMNARGVLHFDAHFRNMLTEGERLCCGDLGLATSLDFDLSDEERAFVSRHQLHDVCYAVTQWVNWLVVALGHSHHRNEFIASGNVSTLPPYAAAIVERFRPVVAIMNEFYRKLHLESRQTRYPAEALQQAWAR